VHPVVVLLFEVVWNGKVKVIECYSRNSVCPVKEPASGIGEFTDNSEISFNPKIILANDAGSRSEIRLVDSNEFQKPILGERI